jgi:predicted lipoprotein
MASFPIGPPIQIACGRARIEVRAAPVLSVIEENVHERISHLSRGTQSVRVVAVLPYLAARAQKAVEVARYANREALHASSNNVAVLRFDQQMHIVGLNAEVHDTNEAPPRCLNLGSHAEE